ncbi:hypothetical protein D9757_014191 [Collybiopsis confluens]|uniref:DUF6699 domain-containing protein n=1 Tax=Collybiopsis confluens TaxID=2823264 RepID=A0A8H5CMS4_9AGAR|nr:hypothetical protein D9757_014191 [Collybiopsis confluens]
MWEDPWGMPPPVEIGPAGGGHILPPPGARFEDGLNMNAFPGLGGEPERRRIQGTPHPRAGVPLGWEYQPPPPHSAPGAFQHHNLPPPGYQWPGQHTPAWAYGAASAGSVGLNTPYQREDGFSSTAWRPPEFGHDNRVDMAFNAGGDSYFSPPGANEQPVTSGSFFARAARSSSRHGHEHGHEHGHGHGHGHHRSHSRDHRRVDDNPWATPSGRRGGQREHWNEQVDSEEEGLSLDEEQDLHQARMRLMDRGHYSQVEREEPDRDLINSFTRMGIQDEQHQLTRHRDRSRGRQSTRPRKSALKRHGGRATSVDEAMLAYQEYDREQRQYRRLLRSREREQVAGMHNSYSPYATNNRLLEGQTYHEKDRISRPRDWRGDYSVKPGLLGRWSSISRHPSDVVEMYDQVKRNPHPLLQRVSSSSSHPPSLFVDLRFPLDAQMHGIFPRLGRPPINIDFAQMAAEPFSPHMRFFHPRLPWYIDIYSASALATGGRPALQHRGGIVGLTVWEVIEGIWKELQRPITSRDFYNQEMSAVMNNGRGRSSSMSSPHPLPPSSPYTGGFSPHSGGPQPITARDLVTAAFRSRCKSVGQLFGDPLRAPDVGRAESEEISQGVRRVDWLGMEEEWVWTGIQRRSGGLWEIKTRRMT